MARTTIAAPLQQQPRHCHLLTKLSAELRNNIYELCLIDPARNDHGPVYIERDADDLDQIPKHSLALLATCRQIYHEAAGLFYNNLHIGFLTPCDCRTFLADNGSKHVTAIKQLSVMIGNYDRGSQALEFVKMLAPMTQLKKLTFDIQAGGIDEDEPLDSILGVVEELKQGIARLPAVEEVLLDTWTLRYEVVIVGDTPQKAKLDAIKNALGADVVERVKIRGR
ncbi:hypothetical protein CLAFUW4_03986 [Fulvia fulva]|uniref:Uncharacterized protein n=1 Tax=Passalora fulva TaxID=5499 RepID=A0A9Q8P7M6_PASFU|nr:uncharacterized protein CLAFUR5_03951 [Fulvia fulva]KAK4627047.1 hypothetical protein CLAFUR4_03972 [Fulvia fulva]KAK4627978.1 hypothetical protein CLAFUR0_03973 [Fulvia fulva]UJO16305.1 hypothetical protein CLAFUR5_03951 [Fulvia fulva]WPV13866.1 hypothetical protein CLAFUW4_03986 [Fulvia fulva]WPV29025.1 hypothetical protein CLAFUW7_03975 [Fulvia fulva]